MFSFRLAPDISLINMLRLVGFSLLLNCFALVLANDFDKTIICLHVTHLLIVAVTKSSTADGKPEFLL